MKRRQALMNLLWAALMAPGFFACRKRRHQMKKEIATPKAPQAIGPYSQGIVGGGLIFVSGQIAVDPATGELIDGDIEVQTRKVLTHLKAVIEAGGSTMDHVVKCTVFLKDMNDFTRMNGVYNEFFQKPYPARAAIEVARLPKDVQVEIEAIALVP